MCYYDINNFNNYLKLLANEISYKFTTNSKKYDKN